MRPVASACAFKIEKAPKGVLDRVELSPDRFPAIPAGAPDSEEIIRTFHAQ